MEFKSLVVVDVETTDIKFAKITEIAMCAVEIDHLEGSELPRVVHSFSMCVNPNKKIQLGASNVSGNSKWMLPPDDVINDYQESSFIEIDVNFQGCTMCNWRTWLPWTKIWSKESAHFSVTSRNRSAWWRTTATSLTFRLYSEKYSVNHLW